MAQVIWTEPAVEDVDRIVDYIAVDNPDAAAGLRKRIVQHVDQLETHPKSGPIIPEFRGSSSTYRQIVEPPCRVFYRVLGKSVYILNVVRGEMNISRRLLNKRFAAVRRSTSSEDSH